MRFANTAYRRFEMNLVAKAGYCFESNIIITGGIGMDWEALSMMIISQELFSV